MDDSKKPKKVRLSGKSHNRYDGYGGSATIGELTQEDIDAVEAMTLGACWIRVSDDGRIERAERFTQLPPASEDPNVPPKTDWTKEAPFLVNPISSRRAAAEI